MRTPIPAPLAGEWRNPTYFKPGTPLLVYDVAQRTFMPVEEANQRAGTGIFFYPDGRYLLARYLSITAIVGCPHYYWGYQQGSVRLSGTTLTLYPALHRVKYLGRCASSSNGESDAPLNPETYTWGVQTEGDTSTALYLQGEDTNLTYLRYSE